MTGAPGSAGADRARAAGALASLVAPLAGWVTGAALVAAASQRVQEGDERAEDMHTNSANDRTRSANDDQAEHLKGAAAGHREAGRAPVDAETESDPDGPEVPLTVKLKPDTSPGPSAGVSSQGTKLGEGVHVRE
jgi:hypothetical protein